MPNTSLRSTVGERNHSTSLRSLPNFMERVDFNLGVRLDPSHDYNEACNTGKAAAFEFIRFNIEDGAYSGGLLQHIALCQFNEEPYRRGFAVGFFSELETLINSAFNRQHQADVIKKNNWNNAELSPLSFRSAFDEEGGEL